MATPCPLPGNQRQRSGFQGGGRRFGLSRPPTRAESVNAAKPPAMLSGPAGGGEGRGGRGGGDSPLSTLSFPLNEQKKKKKKLSLVSRAGFNARQDLRIQLPLPFLATPGIFPLQSNALGASRCHTLSPK